MSVLGKRREARRLFFVINLWSVDADQADANDVRIEIRGDVIVLGIEVRVQIDVPLTRSWVPVLSLNVRLSRKFIGSVVRRRVC